MQQRTLIIAIDLGTSATTACHVIANDSFAPDGKLQRDKGRVVVTSIKDWPGAGIGNATGDVCVPTDLIYNKADAQLLLWGFQAQQYLDDPYPDIDPETVLVVEHIKLLLLDPDKATIDTPASRRYRELRNKLVTTLGKQPEEIFEDFLNEIISHIVGSANNKYFNGISSFKLELVLAFPSGWPEYLHTTVAGIGARAMAKAIAANNLQNMVFGIEDVYTVSETLCGVKEWLRDTIADATTSINLDHLGTNLDELNEGDCFLPVDIGGGTGCLTPLKLISKDPLRVDQLGPTKSLQISGEVVEAEFAAWLRTLITSDDYPEDLPALHYQICRKFKEAKKDCGRAPRAGSTTWNVSAPMMRPNPAKGFGKGHIKMEWSVLEKCFDPAIDALQIAIDSVLRKVGGIKTIVFLGQFGSSSQYLRKRMSESHISGVARLRFSDAGKLNVVQGALSERLNLTEKFVRKSQTLKSYGTLVALPYYPESDAAVLFPDPKSLGAVPFERHTDGHWLKVVEWAIPKGTALENGQTHNDGQRHHTWPIDKNEKIEFEDIIIVSDEIPPPPQLEGKSYTLWTTAHEKNELVVNGQKLEVQQIPFSWNLSMSQKLDATSNDLGPYHKEELESYWFPEEYRKGKRRLKLRRLHYELIWNITEMQVKVHIRALFPNPPGPLTTQLAKERAYGALEKSCAGESRSKALEQDIEISKAAIRGLPEEGLLLLLQEDGRDKSNVQEGSTGSPGIAAPHLLDNQATHHRFQPPGSAEVPSTTSSTRIILNLGHHNLKSPPTSTSNTFKPVQQSSSTSSKTDGRRREGCYTCKVRKKGCDLKYRVNHARGIISCQTCINYKIECHLTAPDWDDAQLNAQLLEWKGLVKLGKRKRRHESGPSNTPPARPTTVNPAELALDTGPAHRNIAPIAPMGQSGCQIFANMDGYDGNVLPATGSLGENRFTPMNRC